LASNEETEVTKWIENLKTYPVKIDTGRVMIRIG
jgi:hypothetical protein